MKRVGACLGLRPEKLEEYRAFHAEIWPEIAAALEEAGFRNYSIYHFRGTLFAYFEYDGPEDEWESRLRRLAAAPRMREWWNLMEPMQTPLEGRAEGEWWATMEEVFHLD